MNYGELREYFKGILNRDDCNDNLADLFISQGIRRTSRLLRTPLQEAKLIYQVTPIHPGFILVPSDYLGVTEVTVNGRVIDRILRKQTEDRVGYFRDGAAFYFNPDLKEGQQVVISYINEFSLPNSASDVTRETLILGDVIVYAALVYAASYFVDERKDGFNGDFVTLVEEVQRMSDIENTTGLIMPMYGGGIV